MSVVTKPSKQSTDVRQAGLVEAALRLAAQRSPADITTTDLAHAVGITQGAVFRHFSSKEAIWLAALAWVTDTLMRRLNTAAALDAAPTGGPEPAAPPDALAALQAVFMAHVDFVVEHPGVPRVIFQELQQPQDTPVKASVRQLMQQYRTLLMRLLTQAQLKKLIAPDADLTGASVLFIGSIQGLVMQSLMSGDVAAMRQQAPAVYALFQRGLQATATHSTQGTP
ncbi:MAG: TetR family transcriptional regulator [Comamonadaceae bacterium]|nr:TetR family transcriptional regulator [Comamonadaceae bacterium]